MDFAGETALPLPPSHKPEAQVKPKAANFNYWDCK